MAKAAPGVRFMLVIAFLDMVGIGLALPVGPHIVAGFLGGDLSQAALYVGLIGALYTGSMFLCAPLLGALSDRFGRLPVLVASLAMSSLSYWGAASAPSLGAFLVARGLGGLGGASLTVAQTYLADVSPPADRARHFGWLGAALGLGFIVGPALGGWLGTFGIRTPFWAAGAVMAASLIYCLVAVPESHDPAHRRAFDWREANPLGWIVTLRRHPAVAGFAFAMFWVWAGQQCLQNTWVLFTAYRFQWGPAECGVSLAIVGITAFIVQGLLMARVVGRLGERTAILGGLLWTSGALVAYGLAGAGWIMYGLIAIASLGGIAMPTLQGYVSKRVGPQEQGATQGALTSLMSLTGVLGPLVANGTFAHFTAARSAFQLPGAPFFLGSAFTLLGAVIAWRLLAGTIEMEVNPWNLGGAASRNR